jgi:hypothetical protein
MSTSRLRRSATAAVLAAASLIGAVLFSAQAANAATTYYEWESEQSTLNLVMTARGTHHGARVGLGPDNNSPDALWYATHNGDNYWSYRLRASEFGSTPVCLDVDGFGQGAAIVVRRCDNSSRQNWTETGGSGTTNRLRNQWSGKYIDQPSGPEFLVLLGQETSLSASTLWTWRSVRL